MPALFGKHFMSLLAPQQSHALLYFRVNCYLHVTSQSPFGGYKQSGIGREMYVHMLITFNSHRLYVLNFFFFCTGVKKAFTAILK